MTDPISCREQIVDKVFQILRALPGAEVERNRRDALTDEELPRDVLFEEPDEEDDTIFVGEDGFALSLIVQHAEAGGPDAASSCNARRAAIRKALLADHSLGGLARDVMINNGNWIGVDTPEGAEGFMLGVIVRYATVAGDPYTFT